MRFFALENPLRLVWSLWPLKNPSSSHGGSTEPRGMEEKSRIRIAAGGDTSRLRQGKLPPKSGKLGRTCLGDGFNPSENMIVKLDHFPK